MLKNKIKNLNSTRKSDASCLSFRYGTNRKPCGLLNIQNIIKSEDSDDIELDFNPEKDIIVHDIDSDLENLSVMYI